MNCKYFTKHNAILFIQMGGGKSELSNKTVLIFESLKVKTLQANRLTARGVLAAGTICVSMSKHAD